MVTQEQLDEICAKGKLVFIFDLDDTLIDFRTQEPFPDRVAHVRELFADGNYIIIQTARQKLTLESTKKQLHKWGIPYHEFDYGHKPKGHMYVDDSAVNADDYFANPKKYQRLFRAIGDSINWWIRKKGGLQ